MPKETSEIVSSLAAKYINFSVQDLMNLSTLDETGNFEKLCTDIRTLAASCLSQDETSDKPIDDETVLYSPDELSEESKGGE